MLCAEDTDLEKTRRSGNAGAAKQTQILPACKRHRFLSPLPSDHHEYCTAVTASSRQATYGCTATAQCNPELQMPYAMSQVITPRDTCQACGRHGGHAFHLFQYALSVYSLSFRSPCLPAPPPAYQLPELFLAVSAYCFLGPRVR